MTETRVVTEVSVEKMYLTLLKKSLTRSIAPETFSAAEPWFRAIRWWFLPFQAFLMARGWIVVRREPLDSTKRS